MTTNQDNDSIFGDVNQSSPSCSPKKTELQTAAATQAAAKSNGEVVEFSRKHTANVHESLSEVRRIIQALASKRDERRDACVRVIERAMDTKLGAVRRMVRQLRAASRHGQERKTVS